MTDTLPIPGPAPGHSPSGSLLPPLNLGNPSLSAQPDAASNGASPPCTSQHSNPEQHQQLEDSESSPAKPHIVQHEETLPVTSVQ